MLIQQSLQLILFISKVNCEGNTSNGVNENISKVLEVYDEETCLETMKGEYSKDKKLAKLIE